MSKLDEAIATMQQGPLDAAIDKWAKDSAKQQAPPVEPSKGKIGFVENIKRGGMGAVADKLTLGVKPLIEATSLYGATKRLRKDRYNDDPIGRYLKEKDETQVMDYLEEQAEIQERGLSIGAQAGNIIGDMLPFMAEFIATGGAASIGKKAVSKGVRRLILRTVGKHAAKSVAGKSIAKGAGWVTAGAIRTALTPHRILSNYIDERMPDINISPEGQLIFKESTTSPFKAAYKAIGTQWVEMASEEAGALIGKVAGKIGKKVLPKAAITAMKSLELDWLSAGTGRTAKDFAKKVATKAGFNGILEEYSEERLGALMKLAIGVDDGPGTTFEKIGRALYPGNEQAFVELIAFAVPGVTQAAVGKVFDEKADKTTYSRRDMVRMFGITQKSSKEERQALWNEHHPVAEAAPEEAEPTPEQQEEARLTQEAMTELEEAPTEQATAPPVEEIAETPTNVPKAQTEAPQKPQELRGVTESNAVPTEGKLKGLAEEARQYNTYDEWTKYESDESFGIKTPRKEISKVLIGGQNLLPTGRDYKYADAKDVMKKWAGDVSDSDAAMAFFNAVKNEQPAPPTEQNTPIRKTEKTITSSSPPGATAKVVAPKVKQGKKVKVVMETQKEKSTNDKIREMTTEEQEAAWTDALVKGDTFTLNNKKYQVVVQSPKTFRVKSDNGEVLSFKKYGNGNFAAEGKHASFFRDAAGILSVDLINENNPFHEPSDIFKLTQKVVESKPSQEVKKKPAKRVVSKEAYERARKRLKDTNKLASGFDPQAYADLLVIGAYHFENGVIKFKEWSAKVLADIGTVKPETLRKAYKEVSGKDAPAKEVKKAPRKKAPQVKKAPAKKAVKQKVKPTKKKATSKQVESKSVIAKQIQATLKDYGLEIGISYDPIVIAEEVEKAENLVNTNLAEAKRIAYSDVKAEDLLNNAVRLAYFNKMIEIGDKVEAAKIGNWIISENKRLGQEIVVNKGFIDDNSPMKFVKQVVTLKMEKTGKKMRVQLKGTKSQKKSAVNRVTDRITKEVKALKNATEAKRMDFAKAQDFIESLRC